ncbi:MAG: leucine-rich repeat protein [Clostridia bacterium]|nr:leucine-rich repeat protein [Clostridia bacterium]
MKKLYAAMAAAGLAGLLALSAGAMYIGDDLSGFTEISVYPMQAEAWIPDGVFSEGEYHEIHYERGWVSANTTLDEDAQAGKDLDFTLAMSWDGDYIYTYVQYVDENGYDSSYAANQMYLGNMLQLNFALGDAGGENLYSVEMTRYDQGDLGAYSWYDYLVSGWLPTAGTDYTVIVEETAAGKDLVTYEARVPFDVFCEFEPSNGERYSMLPLISWGSEGELIHTQLGCGRSEGLWVFGFVNFTLRDSAPVQTENYWPEAEGAFQKLDLCVPYREAEWNPADGEMGEGEYFLIEEDSSWNSASVGDPALLETAKYLDYTLGMSWDQDYLYTYMEFIDPDGHVNEGDAENIWNNGGLQIGLACGDRSGGGFLEYGISRSTADDSLMAHQWNANEGGAYDASGNFNVVVTDLENGTSKVVYEVRTPFDAYTDWGVQSGMVSSVAYVLCWGNNAVAHTQMSSGISGQMGKDAACFADIILTGGPANYIDEEDVGNVAFTVEQATAAWAADGMYSEGEYFDIDVQNTWMSAFSSDPFLTEDVKNLDFDLAMSWDEDYLYSYVKFTAPGGYVPTPAGNPGEMWGYTCLQVGAADTDCTGGNRLEYGLATDTDGDMISANWSDYSYNPEGNYGVFVDGSTVVYELRTPFTAFSRYLPSDGNEYGIGYVMSTSIDTGNLRHTQLASGISGDPGKDAARFATITLNGETYDYSVAWELSDDGTLTVSGSNPIMGYNSADEQPWAEVRDQIKAIVIEGSVGIIGTNAFLDCVNAETITIGEGIEEIAIFAFEHCAAVKTIHIPESVTNISVGAFKRCYSLEAFTVDADNDSYTAQDGVLFTKDMIRLLRYPLNKQDTFYKVPDSVVVLSAAAMEELQNLTDLTLPVHLESIENWCFYGTTGLQEIRIPARLEFLDSYAFGGCTSLTDVYFAGSKPWVRFAEDAFADTTEGITLHYHAGKEGWDTVEGYRMDMMGFRGDITGDDAVTENDLLLLQQYYSGYPTEISMDAADVDGDGRLTRRDVMIYARYMDNWEAYDLYF